MARPMGRPSGTPSRTVPLTQQFPNRGGQRAQLLEPLTASLVGVPVWWVLGMFQAIFFVSALLMALHLARRRNVELPRFFMVWMLFLVWSLGGVLTLQVDAPGALPGASPSRYITFSYRYAWYLVCTVMLLYVVNTSAWLSTERICRAVSWFFVALVGGGLVGLLLPHLDFPSLLEVVLPRRIAHLPMAQDLIHLRTAQIQEIIGDDPEPRPSAPFAFTNEWGMAVATTMPFFVQSWWTSRAKDRVVVFVVLAAATLPIVASLNRGLWLSILAVAAFTAFRSALLGDMRRLALLAGVGTVLAAVFVVSPLGSTIETRFQTPHSDQVRENLGMQSVVSALEGSPLIGFGTTRDVAGNFKSIAGGASAICPGCEPPPLGTHGQAWLLIFFSGVGGLTLYVVFMAAYLVRHMRSRAPGASAALGSLFVFLITLPIYIATGINLIFAFIAIGVLARSTKAEGVEGMGSLRELSSSVRAGAWLVMAGIALGAGSGLAFHRHQGDPVRASQSILVPAVDMTGQLDAPEFTLDSEAELARSATVLTAVARATEEPSLSQVANNLSIGAKTNTRVLTMTYQDVDEDRAVLALETAVDEYLTLRADLHQTTTDGLQRRLTAQYDSLQMKEESLQSMLKQRDSTAGSQLQSDIALVNADLGSATETAATGRPVSQVRVHHPNDALVVRVGGGAVAGGVLGLALAASLGIHMPAGRRRISRTTGLPLLLTLNTRLADDPAGLVLGRVQPFLPLRAVIADPRSARATHLAAEVDQNVTTRSGRSGRTLLIVTSRTSAAGANSMLEECRRMKLTPIGLVVVTSAAR